MALQLSKTLDTGITGNYWKITKIDINNFENRVDIYVTLFLNKAIRNAGNKGIDLQHYVLTWPHFVFTSADLDINNPIKVAYNKLKILKKSDLDPSILGQKTDGLVWGGAIDV